MRQLVFRQPALDLGLPILRVVKVVALVEPKGQDVVDVAIVRADYSRHQTLKEGEVAGMEVFVLDAPGGYAGADSHDGVPRVSPDFLGQRGRAALVGGRRGRAFAICREDNGIAVDCRLLEIEDCCERGGNAVLDLGVGVVAGVERVKGKLRE